jgi:hypothetical protein
MNKGLVMVIVGIMSLNIMLSGCIDNNTITSLSLDDFPPIIIFDKKDDTLMVLASGSDLNWSNVEITSGQCEIPSGSISAGDKVTNCTGNLVLIWNPSNTVIGEWDFRK